MDYREIARKILPIPVDNKNYDFFEISQATIRIFTTISALICFIYVHFIPENFNILYMFRLNSFYAILCSLFYLIVSITIYLDILLRRHVNNFRRHAALMADCICITYFLAIDGIWPMYILLFWITIGNWLRYDYKKMAICVILSSVIIVLLIWIFPYRLTGPFLPFTLILTTILAPAYLCSLLVQIRRATDAATAATLAKSRLLAQASHDLRQPIHAIGLFTDSLLDAQLGQEERRMVENIDKSLSSVTRLFQSLLDVSIIDSGQINPRMETISINQLLREIVQRNSKAAEWAKSDIHLVQCSHYVRIDPNLLTTMVQNIISNAIKYAPGQPILIGCRHRKGKLAIEIWDRGNGISEEHLPKVFDEFYRVKELGLDIEGVGLGLAIVKRLATLLSLEIAIRSRKGRGTMVAISGITLIAGPAGSVLPLPIRSSMPLTDLRVLLIDDDPAVLTATSSLMERWGCIVETSATLPTRIRHCDVIIADYDLASAVTGDECIAYVRNRLGYFIPAAIITGHNVTEIIAKLKADSIEILSKPVHPNILRATLVALKMKISHYK
ncbi:hybrid sensor histidine kinase/response regulator [Sphingobium sp. BYY-5]|uniref:hybrid sensor histidine kinase/response regulator n=1 Tax=Sphingobium sp. BYY-5 TaxID=2926400 RepID=UPI001FA75DCB|nr:hybrid sensor histidine kinase/response regulator [Sphingobium sp. BYY-5]MCI4592205.1 hybrid sensor histidine kinase/response regulator [Sphingobium sp. BYY-5]